MSAVIRAGLTGIMVIIKGLASGFNQPSTGINWVPLVSVYVVLDDLHTSFLCYAILHG